MPFTQINSLADSLACQVRTIYDYLTGWFFMKVDISSVYLICYFKNWREMIMDMLTIRRRELCLFEYARSKFVRSCESNTRNWKTHAHYIMVYKKSFTFCNS